MTAVAIANVVGAPLSGWIMDTFDGVGAWAGWRWLFVLESVPSMLMGVAVLLLLPDSPATARWLRDDERALVAARLTEDRAAAVAGDRSPTSVREALTSGRVWALAFVYFTSALALYGVNFWMPTIIQELGVARTAYLRIGLLTMIPWGVAVVAMTLWGAHSDRTGERRGHVAGALAVTASGLALLAFVGTAVVPSLVALTLVSAGVLSAMSTFWSIPTAFLRGSAAAAGIAWINSIGNLGGHFGPDLIGRVRDATGGSAGAFLTLAGVVAAGAVAVLLVTRTGQVAGR
jgi:nitrate/nitrite transporter NarK